MLDGVTDGHPIIIHRSRFDYFGFSLARLGRWKANGISLQFASGRLRGHEETCLIAMRQNGMALKFAQPVRELKNEFLRVLHVLP